MNEVNNTNSIFNDLSVANTRSRTQGQDEELGQSAFLELVIAQLQNQDPTNPQENGDFIAQLAQFSSVESLDSLNNNFTSFTNSFIANQALQASSLVGRSVSIPGDTTRLDFGGIISASAELESSAGDVFISVFSESGELVDQINTGPQPAGDLVLRWDGLNAELNGELIERENGDEEGLPPGNYQFEFTVFEDGEPVQLETSLSANVNSVSVSQNGELVLNVAGSGPVNLSEVRQFN